MEIISIVPEQPQTEQSPEPIIPDHLQIAQSYIGTVDNGDNTGTTVNQFLSSVGLNPGYPWCAAFVSFCLDQPTDPAVIAPEMRSALASDFISRKSIKASHVITGIRKPKPGYLAIYRRGNGIFGHIAMVEHWDQKCGQIIAGNTSPPDGSGSEYDGGGVWSKERCIHPGNYFRIVSFTPVVYS
ncbi:MAG: CHAP domain-containing protein [Balneolaceae bacterium]